MEHAVLSWILAILIFLVFFVFIRRKTISILARAICGAGVLLLGLGVLGNTLVITANGGRMPVERVDDWSGAPSFLSGPSGGGLLGRGIGGAIDFESRLQPEGIHADVGKSPGSIARPNLAWLDDHCPVIIRGDRITYSPGDALIVLGILILVPSSAAALAIGIWIGSVRRLRRPKP